MQNIQVIVIVIGDSHIVAIKKAYKRYTNRLNLDFSFINLSAPESQESSEDASNTGDDLHSAINDLRPHIIIACIAGNTHNIFGLLEHPSRFDFVLPECTDLAKDQVRQLIPFNVIQQLLEAQMSNSLLALEALRHNHAIPVIHLESPPTIPSEKHIRKHPGIFKELIDKRGVTPAIIRYKLWRLHSSIMHRTCEKNDILFLPVPSETQDEQGMMVERAWNPDPTHGNEWYGRKVLDQLADLIPKVINSL